MKKVNLLAIVALFFVGFGFSSCSKCVTCEDTLLGIDPDMEICADDYATDALYDLEVAYWEALGYTCN